VVLICGHSGFTLGFIIVPVVSEHSALPRAIEDIIVSNDHMIKRHNHYSV
jgi:hypothetical protein